MRISYNWLKWYVPDAPEADKLADIITYHLAEVESVEKREDGDSIFEIKILPNRAHDLLSHQGMAKEISSLLNIKYVDPTPKYKVPDSTPTKLIQRIETPKCRRYMGRVVRNVKVGPSPEWVVKHLESIGQRSINNIVDATNIVMFDCGQPTHVFDMAKVKDLKLQVRNATNGEKIKLLNGEEKILNDTMLVIADDYGNSLDIAGVKGGKYAELVSGTTDIILEAANFDPISIRKTAQSLNIFTDAKKRFENDLSPELDAYAMTELSALIYEMCSEAIFEDVVDVYPQKQEQRKLSFRIPRISSILGVEVSVGEVKEILGRYNFEYTEKNGIFEIVVPYMRLDLVIEEDMTEEIGRIMGYDKVKPKIPKINFKPKANETYAKIQKAKGHLLSQGYHEVMTYVFRDKGEVEVMQSASDKKFLRTNLADGLKESLKLNKLNAPFLGLKEIRIFEIGTVWTPKEEIHVAFNNEEAINEKTLDDFCKNIPSDLNLKPRSYNLEAKFKMWSLFPFITRDVAVWVSEEVASSEVLNIIKENSGNMVVRGPELFDEFKKDGKTSYAFRTVFQSYDHTLTDAEVNEIMSKIKAKIEEKSWQVR